MALYFGTTYNTKEKRECRGTGAKSRACKEQLERVLLKALISQRKHLERLELCLEFGKVSASLMRQRLSVSMRLHTSEMKKVINTEKRECAGSLSLASGCISGIYNSSSSSFVGLAVGAHQTIQSEAEHIFGLSLPEDPTKHAVE